MARGKCSVYDVFLTLLFVSSVFLSNYDKKASMEKSKLQTHQMDPKACTREGHNTFHTTDSRGYLSPDLIKLIQDLKFELNNPDPYLL